MGDLAFVGRYDGDPPPKPFHAVAPFFNKSDLVIANLESPLVDEGRALPDKCTLRGNTEWATIMRATGIDVLSLANNHSMDYGEAGLYSTMTALKRAGIAFVGAGRNRTEACAPVFITRAGCRLAIIGRTSVFVASRSFAGNETPGTAWFDMQETLETIRACRQAADHVILSIHWGLEEYHYPSPTQRRWAQAFVDAGASLILGHHPHVLQGIENINGAIVAYSLGNFVFDHFPWSFSGRQGEMHNRMVTLSRANFRAGMLMTRTNGQRGWRQRFLPTCIDDTGAVVLEETLLRQKEIKRFCKRLYFPGYNRLWKIYAVISEFQLRLMPLVRGKLTWHNIRKVRLSHFQALFTQMRRAAKISMGKSSNPYD